MYSKKRLAIIFLIITTIGISFGGLIIRNLNSSDAWQVAFYRGLGFIASFTIILIFRYRKYFFNSIVRTSWWGLIGGLFALILLSGIVLSSSIAAGSIIYAIKIKKENNLNKDVEVEDKLEAVNI